MHDHSNMLLNRFFTLTIAVSLLSLRTAESAIYVKYDNIEGEATEKGYEKWSDVSSVNWGAHRPLKGSTGSTRFRGLPVVKDLEIKMPIDKSTPYLLNKCLKGETIPTLEIDQTKTVLGFKKAYIKYELKNVLIISYNVTHWGDESRSPMDEVEMNHNFEKLKMTYWEFDEQGEPLPGGEHTMEYDVTKA